MRPGRHLRRGALCCLLPLRPRFPLDLLAMVTPGSPQDRLDPAFHARCGAVSAHPLCAVRGGVSSPRGVRVCQVLRERASSPLAPGQQLAVGSPALGRALVPQERAHSPCHRTKGDAPCPGSEQVTKAHTAQVARGRRASRDARTGRQRTTYALPHAHRSLDDGRLWSPAPWPARRSRRRPHRSGSQISTRSRRSRSWKRPGS